MRDNNTAPESCDPASAAWGEKSDMSRGLGTDVCGVELSPIDAMSDVSVARDETCY